MHPVFPPSSPIAIVQDELPVAATTLTTTTTTAATAPGIGRESGNADTFVRLTKLEFESSSSESGNEYPEEPEEKIYREGYALSGANSPNLPLLQKQEYQKRQKITTQDIYPTPVPSSSIGHTSSPVKSSPTFAFETRPKGTEETKPFFNDLDSNPFIDGPSKQEQNFETSWAPSQNYTVSSKVLHLSIEPNNTQRVIIGRHREVCDFQLPSYKTISRKHASISYIPQRNQLRLECYGSNGIYVTLPRNLNCVLVKPVHDMPVFELTGEHTARMLEKFQGHGHIQQKSVFRDFNSTSFGLEKGESVLMPFINGTILDFRQVRVAIGMNQNSYLRTNDFSDDSYSDSDSGIEIESDHSFIEHDTDGEHMEYYSSDTPSVTNTSTNTRKRKRGSKSGIYMNPRWKKPLGSKVVKMATQEVVPREPADNPVDNKVSTSKLKPELAPNSKPKQKQKQKLKSKSRRTPDEILASLRDKNINIKEVQHVLANHLAFGNTLQVPLSQLRTVSSQIRTLQKDELRYVLGNVRCIGIIYRQGKDAAGKPLEEEYFYDMEKDDDLQRKNLVSVTKGGRSELRSCRRTHKQYFWKKPT